MPGALGENATLAARWSLGFEDATLLHSKPAIARLGFAAQLMFYCVAGRFGRAASEVPGAVIAYLAEQIGVPVADLASYERAARWLFAEQR